MRYIIILLLFIEALQAQQPYNFRFENGEIQALGQLVYELEDSYLGIGRGFDTIDYRRGVYATEFDKETGEILSTSKYNRQGEEYYFNRGNTVIDISGVPYFIFHGSDTILLATYSDIDNEIVIEKKNSCNYSYLKFIYLRL